MTDDTKAAFVRVYHAASGLQVSVPLSLETPLTATNAAVISESIGALLAGGMFTVALAGAEAGDTVEEVGAVSRRAKDDGTPILDLFNPNAMLIHKVFTHYLDGDDMIASFEAATGLKLADVPVWDGDQALKKDSKNAARYIIPVKKPAKVALKDNPRHDPNETEVAKKKPKYLFSCWLGVAPTLPPVAPPQQPTTTTSAPAGNSKPDLKVLDGENPQSFGEIFKPSAPPTIGSQDMLRLLNRALQLKLVKSKTQFEERVHDLKASGAIRDASSEQDVMTALGKFDELMRTTA